MSNKNDIAIKVVIDEKLYPYQKDILNEAINKNPASGGLELPMGAGKTLLGLILCLLNCSADGEVSLIVVEPTLVVGWSDEFKNFFKNLTYGIQFFHSSFSNVTEFVIDKNTKIVITTPYFISAAYDTFCIEQKFVSYSRVGVTNIKFYDTPHIPYMKAREPTGLEIMYSRKWNTIIVDEAQNFTNVHTKICKALASLCSEYRWMLSGTMFSEPTADRLFGYYLMINHPTIPRNMPSFKKLIHGNSTFSGLSETTVTRTKNDMYKEPIIHDEIVSVALSDNEALIYTSIRSVMINIANQLMMYKISNDKEQIAKFNNHILVLITYLRESLVSPIVPLASIAISCSHPDKNTEIAMSMMDSISGLNIDEWLDDEESAYSMKMRKAKTIIDRHKDERIVVFTCFRMILDIFIHFVKRDSDREIFVIESKHSIQTRSSIVSQFSRSKSGILFLTYQLGSRGLNLQSATCCLLLDEWWNSGHTQQSIARINRFGQDAAEIFVYRFTSNTALERELYKKHKDKLEITHTYRSGSCNKKVRTMSMMDIVMIIKNSENVEMLNSVKKRIEFNKIDIVK